EAIQPAEVYIENVWNQLHGQSFCAFVPAGRTSFEITVFKCKGSTSYCQSFVLFSISIRQSEKGDQTMGIALAQELHDQKYCSSLVTLHIMSQRFAREQD